MLVILIYCLRLNNAILDFRFPNDFKFIDHLSLGFGQASTANQGLGLDGLQ